MKGACGTVASSKGEVTVLLGVLAGEMSVLRLKGHLCQAGGWEERVGGQDADINIPRNGAVEAKTYRHQIPSSARNLRKLAWLDHWGERQVGWDHAEPD